MLKNRQSSLVSKGFEPKQENAVPTTVNIFYFIKIGRVVWATVAAEGFSASKQLQNHHGNQTKICFEQ